MTDTDDERRQQIALFRYGVIAELVHWPEGRKGLYEQIQAKAAREYTIPASTRTRIAAETIRHWLKAYRKGGFEALLPRPRADRGRVRRLPAAVAEALLAIKEANPALSVQLVIREARARPEVPAELPLPAATVHRLLARHGLMDKRTGAGGDSDRRRFAFAEAGELWMSDVMHGPSVVVGERVKRKTYLLAFLDDATRVIPHAAFALSENTQTFLPVLKLAIEKRGLPQRLYVDPGSPLNRSSSTGGLPEADQGSAGVRLPAAVLAVLHAVAEQRRDPCSAPAREQQRVQAPGRTPFRGFGNVGG